MLEQLQTEYSQLAVELQQLRNEVLITLEGLSNEKKTDVKSDC
ncbi:hypothetical protein ACQKMD_11025 [Viridibacillus sp. NPDC096237]